MKKQSNQKSLDRFQKPSSQGPIRQPLPAGLFSTQYSFFSSVLSTKNKKENQSKSSNRKASPNFMNSNTQRAETPSANTNHSPFSAVYHLKNLANKQKKKSNLISKDSDLQKFSNLIVQNKSMDQNSISSKVNEIAEKDTSSILQNLKQLNSQMNSQVFSQLSQQIVLGWQKQLVLDCEKLIQFNKSKKLNNFSDIAQQQQESSIVIEKLLADERRNRLQVEEQTSKLIQSQELQIQAYIEKIKILELKLLEKPKKM